MATYLGIDTSNYTTAMAVYDSCNQRVVQVKRLLPVKEGSLGLKQSDAVFAHVKQLPQIAEELFFDLFPDRHTAGNILKSVGVSTKPRDVEDSYMPCFLVGKMAAATLSAANGLAMYEFSHQSGHIAAALYSAGRLDLIGREFIAFHFSGGTTECLHVSPSEKTVFATKIIYQSLDLKCGQAVDRVGKLLGLSFPAGKELEILANSSPKSFAVKASFRDGNCSVSGLENQCERLLKSGENREDIAKYCMEYICSVVEKMTAAAKKDYPLLPIIYSGGVMSNKMIQERISTIFGGSFAEPEFSSDNAAGAAILASVMDERVDGLLSAENREVGAEEYGK